MAKDILALGGDDEEQSTESAAPRGVEPAPSPSAEVTTGPRPVPDLDAVLAAVDPDWSSASPMAADIFLSASKPKAKRKLRKMR